MSRVRILNLPPSVTEASLTKHFQQAKLPSSAPPLIITDCSLKRAPDGRIVRMGFLGFKTAAAGQFVVKHFNGSYLGTAKIAVELATGLDDASAQTTTRTRQRQEKQAASTGSAVEGNALKKSRTEGKSSQQQPHEANNVGSIADPKKLEFIENRLKNSGPTWAAEMMLPPTMASSAVTNESASIIAPGSDDCVVEDGEDAAFRKQVELNEVDDLDFLASKETNQQRLHEQRASTGTSKNDRDVSFAGDSEDLGEVPQKETGGKDTGDQQPIGWGEHAWDTGTDDPSIARRSHRVRFANLPYSATEEDVKNFASSKVGPVAEVHLPLTRDTQQSTGAAFVKFVTSDDAVAALTACRGAIFMGRLLRVSAAEDDPYANAAKAAGGAGDTLAAGGHKMSEYQAQKMKDKKHADATGVSWNSTYISSHTAVESVAKRIGATGGDVVNVASPGAAVRAAISEAFITSEAKKVLSDEGIDFSALESGANSIIKSRSNTTILVKNLTPTCDFPQLVKLFAKFGSLETTAVPDSAGFALFAFVHAQDARVAFQRLAYKNFCGSPLFLEWAPIGAIKDTFEVDETNPAVGGSSTAAGGDDDVPRDLQSKMIVFTLFISNLPFNVTQAQLEHFLQDSCPRLAGASGWARHVKKLALQSSKGWAFLTLADEPAFQYVQARLQGKSMDHRKIICQASKASAAAQQDEAGSRNGTLDAEAEDSRMAKSSTTRGAASGVANGGVPHGCNPVKLIVKNLPFEATEQDLRDLFAAFTEIKAVRVPRKLHQFGTAAHRTNNHRGFGFVEFLTSQEAANALKALSATHLYGRHLVLQYAKMDEE